MIAYAGVVWIPPVVGWVGGWLAFLTVWQTARADGAPESSTSALIWGGAYATAGALIGVVAAAVALVTAWIGPRSAALRVILATAGVLTCGALVAAALRLPWAIAGTASAVAAAAAAAFGAAAELRFRRRQSGGPPYEPVSTLAVFALLVGTGLALPGMVVSLALIREVLHIGCTWLVGGEAGDGMWMCADGIGYIGPGLSFGGPLLLGVVAGTAVSLTQRTASRRRWAFAVAALFPLVWTAAWTILATEHHRTLHPDALGVWGRSIMPALLLAALAVGVLVTAGRGRAASTALRVSLGGALLFASLVVQPALLPVVSITSGFAVAATRPSAETRAVSSSPARAQ